jgi:hypothetical protein
MATAWRRRVATLIEGRTLDLYDALLDFEREAGIAGETVEIACPICGVRQTAERAMWEFSVTRQATFAGLPPQRGHPYTCTGAPEDSHPKVEMQRAVTP